MKRTLVFISLLWLLVPLMLFSEHSGRELHRDFENIKINNDSTTEVQNEEQIVMNPTDSTNIVAVWRDFRFGYRQVYYGFTFDGGVTWNQERFVEPQYAWDSDPGLTVDSDGNFYVVLLS
ncbi:MAG: hypothetical protein E3J78_08365, partial [Candidatus Cloacimonadota bacterium]